MRVVYQDDQVTEYDDGTEEVRFTDDEHDVMARSPRYFGLCLPCGHDNKFFNAAEGCSACLDISEAGEDYELAAASYAVAPLDEVVR